MEVKKTGQIVMFKFPQTDFRSGKMRPALLLARLPGNYDDWLICMVSSQMHQYIDGLDEIIKNDSTDFIQSGLKSESLIRITRIAVVTGDILLGTIGEISPERLICIKHKLADWIKTTK